MSRVDSVHKLAQEPALNRHHSSVVNSVVESQSSLSAVILNSRVLLTEAGAHGINGLYVVLPVGRVRENEFVNAIIQLLALVVRIVLETTSR